MESFLSSTESINEAFQLDSYLSGNEDMDWEIQRTLSTLDLSQVPEFLRRQKSREAALKLREVLDRVDLPPLEEIPGPEYSQIPAIWQLPGTAIEIERVSEGPRAGDYLFSAHTIAELDDYYDRVKGFPYQEGALKNFYNRLRHISGSPVIRKFVVQLPPWAHRVWMDLAVWQWIGYLGGLLLGLAALGIIRRLGRLSRNIDPSRHRVGLLVSSVVPLTSLLVPIGLKWFMNQGLSLYGGILEVTDFVLNILLIITALFAVWGVGYRIVEVLADATSRSMDRLLVRLFGRLATIFVAVAVLIEGCNNLGIPMTTLLAGAGVGGLALALGAQAAVKNIVGSMMILLDKPYRVGERIVAGKFDGVVEDVGIRSTRIRLLTGHEVTVPNEEMARSEIENISRRPYIRKLFQFYLPLNTTEARLAGALRVIRECLEGHDGMVPEFPPRAFVGDFERDGIKIVALIWYHPPDYWGFQKWMEATSLKILRRLEEEGIRLVPPAQKIELEGGSNSGEGEADRD
tara:strand:- start:12938 stop:14485 length:1548 start_codon:yes stop_codon:yes gene_type:complete